MKQSRKNLNEMSTYTEEVGKKLNGLLERTYDAEKGFKNAAENISNPALKNYFNSKAKERYNFGHELKDEIKSFNQEIDKGGSLTGTAHRAWMDIKALLSLDNEESMLEESIRGEKTAIADYDGEIKIYSRKDYKNKSQQASINKNHWGNDKYDEVNCLKLESLVAKYNMLNKEFDLLQIDAEGADDLILLNCDFKNVKPKEIRFESVHLRGGRLNKVLQHLKKCGYEKTKDNYLKYVKAFPGYEHYDTVVKKIN